MATQPTFLSMNDIDFTLVLRNGTQLTRDETRTAVRILRTGASARQLNGLVADFHDAAKHFAESSSSTMFKQLVVHYRAFIEFVVWMEVATGKPLLFANTAQHGTKMLEHGQAALQILENLRYPCPRWDQMQQDCLAMLACGGGAERMICFCIVKEMLLNGDSLIKNNAALQPHQAILIEQRKVSLQELEALIEHAVTARRVSPQIYVWSSAVLEFMPDILQAVACTAIMAGMTKISFRADDCSGTAPVSHGLREECTRFSKNGFMRYFRSHCSDVWTLDAQDVAILYDVGNDELKIVAKAKQGSDMCKREVKRSRPSNLLAGQATSSGGGGSGGGASAASTSASTSASVSASVSASTSASTSQASTGPATPSQATPSNGSGGDGGDTSALTSQATPSNGSGGGGASTLTSATTSQALSSNGSGGGGGGASALTSRATPSNNNGNRDVFPIAFTDTTIASWGHISNIPNHRLKLAKISVAPPTVTVQDCFTIVTRHANAREGACFDVSPRGALKDYDTNGDCMLVVLPSWQDVACTWMMFQTMVDAYNLSLRSAQILVLTADSLTEHLAKRQALQENRVFCLVLPVLHKFGRSAWIDAHEKPEAYRDLIHVALVGKVMQIGSLFRNKLFCLPTDRRTGLRPLPISAKFQTTPRRDTDTACKLRRFTQKQDANCVKYVEEKFGAVAALLQDFAQVHPLLQVNSSDLGCTSLETGRWLPGGYWHEKLKTGCKDAIERFCNLLGLSPTCPQASAAPPPLPPQRQDPFKNALTTLGSVKTVYYSTTLQNALEILDKGFLEYFTVSNLGRGVYASPSQHKASDFLGSQTDIILVVKLSVTLSKHNTRIVLASDAALGWHDEYVAAYAPAGVLNAEEVLCIADTAIFGSVSALRPKCWRSLHESGYMIYNMKLVNLSDLPKPED